MPDDPLDYASPATKTRGPRDPRSGSGVGVDGRAATTWAKLLAVWAIGLVSWSLYLVAILYLWIKFL